jgi:hypothetical protein
MLAAMMPLTQDLILGNNKPILKLTYNMMIFAVSNNSALMDILLPNYSCETEQIKTNFKIALKVAADNGSLSSKIIAVIKTCGYNCIILVSYIVENMEVWFMLGSIVLGCVVRRHLIIGFI